MNRRIIGIVAALLGVQTTSPAQAPTPTIIVRYADPAHNTAIGNSLLQDQSFVVEVRQPQSTATPPKEITVKFQTGNGTVRELAIPETSPGSGSYVSQPITAKSGAEKTGRWEKHYPGSLSRAMDGFNTGDGDAVSVLYGGSSQSFKVYDTNVTQAIGQYNQAFAKLRHDLNDAIVALKTVLKKPLKPKVKAKLEDTIRIAQARLKLMDQMDHLLANPPARQGVGDYVGTLWWKVGVQIAYWNDVQGDPDKMDPNEIRQNWQMGQNIAEKYRQQANNQLVVAIASGVYVAATSATFAGPIYTLTTGKNVFGQQATPEEIESAAINLMAAVILHKVTPAAIDAITDSMAEGLNPMGRRSTPTGGAAIGNEGPGAAKAGRSGRPLAEAADPSYRFPGYQARDLPTGPPDPVLMEKQLNTGIQEITTRGVKAKSLGIPSDWVDGIVNNATEEARSAAGDPAKQQEILADADWDIAEKMFQKEHPNLVLIDNPNELDLIGSVRAKAALEAAGKPQRWTTAEAAKLKDLNSNPAYGNAFALEHPLWSEDPGYSPVVTGDDMANISKVAGKGGLNLDDGAASINNAGKQFQARPIVNNQPVRSAESPTPATGAEPRHETQILKPGEIKNTVGNQNAGLRPQFDLDQLKLEIGQKRQIAAGKTARFGQAPVSGERVATGGKTMETQVIKPENLQALTPEEIGRFAPEDIRKLPAAFRDQLPLNQLSPRQLEAVADSGRVLTPGDIKALTPETIQRLPASLRDSIPLDGLTRDQLRAVAEASGVTTSPVTTFPQMTSPSTSVASGAVAAHDLQNPPAPRQPGGDYRGLDGLGKALAGVMESDSQAALHPTSVTPRNWRKVKKRVYQTGDGIGNYTAEDNYLIDIHIEEDAMKGTDPAGWKTEKSSDGGTVTKTSPDGKTKYVGKIEKGQIVIDRIQQVPTETVDPNSQFRAKDNPPGNQPQGAVTPGGASGYVPDFSGSGQSLGVKMTYPDFTKSGSDQVTTVPTLPALPLMYPPYNTTPAWGGSEGMSTPNLPLWPFASAPLKDSSDHGGAKTRTSPSLPSKASCPCKPCTCKPACKCS